MATITHFAVRVTRYDELTHFYSPDCLFFSCTSCGKAAPEVYRLRGERSRNCFSCTSSTLRKRCPAA